MTASLRLVPAAEPRVEAAAETAGTTGDLDGDIGLFAMSAASAEQVTVQIRTLLDRSWEYLALAYKGRAFLALGYASWDAYVDARFGDLRIAVPREHRHHAVAALTGVSMSIRAMAKLLGVGVGTVHREMTDTAGVPAGTPDPESPRPSTLGRDGKHYPPRRTPVAAPCRICGEHHADDPSECPWELYAQGTGPEPGDPLPGGWNRRPSPLAARPAARPAPARQLTSPAGSRLSRRIRPLPRRAAAPAAHSTPSNGRNVSSIRCPISISSMPNSARPTTLLGRLTATGQS